MYIYSIVGLVFVVLGSSFILFSIEVEFLSFIILLVYIGAIAVLFVFIILALQLQEDVVIKKKMSISLLEDIVYMLFFLKVCVYFYSFNSLFCQNTYIFSHDFLGNLKYMGNDIGIFVNLFSQKFVFLIIVGFILLFAMVGSIALCIKENKI